MALGGQLGGPSGVQEALGGQFGGQNGVQVALGGQFEGPSGVQVALGVRLGAVVGPNLALNWQSEGPTWRSSGTFVFSSSAGSVGVECERDCMMMIYI